MHYTRIYLYCTLYERGVLYGLLVTAASVGILLVTVATARHPLLCAAPRLRGRAVPRTDTSVPRANYKRICHTDLLRAGIRGFVRIVVVVVVTRGDFSERFLAHLFSYTHARTHAHARLRDRPLPTCCSRRRRRHNRTCRRGILRRSIVTTAVTNRVLYATTPLRRS